jgi:hypothetical protein
MNPITSDFEMYANVCSDIDPKISEECLRSSGGEATIPNCSVPIKTGTLLVFQTIRNTSKSRSSSRKFVALSVCSGGLCLRSLIRKIAISIMLVLAHQRKCTTTSPLSPMTPSKSSWNTWRSRRALNIESRSETICCVRNLFRRRHSAFFKVWYVVYR